MATNNATNTANPTGVTAASYTNANITVNAAGLITAASNGSGGGGASSYLTYNGATPAIKGSGNVTSVTHSSAGKYIVNWTSAFADGFYSACVSTSDENTSTMFALVNTSTNIPTTSALYIETNNIANFVDNEYTTVIVAGT